jgi:GT2 family glycosyltransferase
MAQSFTINRTNHQVSIILVTWNSRKHIEQCLECVSKQTFKNFEIIIVDNDSQDHSVDYVIEHYAHLRIIQNKENVGFAKANNQGIKAAQGEFIFLLNPDVFLEPSFLEELVTFLSPRPQYGSVGGKLLLFKNGYKSRIIDSTGLFLGKSLRARDRGNLKPDRNQYDAHEQIFAVCGAAVLFRREALERIMVEGEYFDEDFFAYYEDLDLGWRLQLSGFESGYTPRAIAYHVRGGSGGAAKFRQKGPDMQRLTLRNRYLMLIKNLSLPNLLFFFPYFFLTEVAIVFYACIRAPYLLKVYVDIGKSLGRFRKKRSFIQSSRIRDTRYIRNWIKMTP